MSASRPLHLERPEVLRGLPASGHAVVEASAGTGKTHTIESLVVELLLVRGLPVESLLVVTFTEKAAAELTKRIRDRLRALARGEVPEAPAGRDARDCWLVGEEERRRLRRALASFGNASISTIHSFCRGVLGEYAFAGGQLLSLETVPEEAALRRAVLDVARGRLATDPALSPWLEAWFASGPAPRDGTRLDGLVKLLCGLRRVRGEPYPVLDPPALAEAVRSFPPPPASEAALRATLRAGGLKDRSIDAVLDLLLRVCRRVEEVRDDADAPDLYLRLAGDGDLSRDLAEVLSKAFGKNPLRDPDAAALRDACIALRRRLVPLPAAVASVVSPLVEERLRRLKSEEGLVDFSDMLALVEEALAGERGAELRRALRSRYRAALIDEFQDTDELQWSVFSRLFLDDSEGHSLFLVGDPKQAIYRFRGADVETYLAARDVIAPGAERRLVLSTSWRATRDLAEALNLLGDDRGPAALLSPPIAYGEPLTCAREERSLVDAKGAPAPPVLLLEVPADPSRGAADTKRLVGRALAREVRSVLGGSLSYGDRGAEAGIRRPDVFVLTRTGAEAEEVAGYLGEEGVLSSLVRREGLFAGAEAEDVRALLLALDDPDDPARRARLLLSAFSGLSLDDVARAGGRPSDAGWLAPLRAWHLAARGRSWETLLPRILDESGLARRALLMGGARERSLARTEQLLEHLAAEGVRTRASAGELAAWLSERGREDELAVADELAERAPSQLDAVPVLTIHASKGLEATVVFLFGGFTRRAGGDDVSPVHHEDRRLAVVGRPDDDALRNAIRRERDAEERRLLYVAMTRAKARVVLPYFPAGSGAAKGRDHLEGGYEPLNERLRALVPTLPGRPQARLFAVAGLDAAAPPAPPRPERPLASWTPPAIAPLPDEEAERERETRFLASRSGLVLTSFSGLKATARRRAAVEREAPGRLESDAPSDAPRDPAFALPEGELPPGIPTGLLLHSLLEEADLDAVAASASPAEWAEDPAFAPRARALLARHGLVPSHLPRALDLVHAALTTRFDLGRGRSLPPLARAPRVVREMEFLFPLPPDGGRERGFVQGFVDAVVESDGKVFVLDWKSDFSPSYDPASLAAHVEASYALQARLYSAAVARLLGLGDEAAYEARFGGWVYVFLRALGPLGPRAAVSGRVPFREIAGLDADLARLLDEAEREPAT